MPLTHGVLFPLTKYLIKTGGENVYPAEIERVLLAHPSVVEAAVVRALDAKWGEAPVAFVACGNDRPDADALMNLCREILAGYKRPRELHFIAFDDSPDRPAERSSGMSSKPG